MAELRCVVTLLSIEIKQPFSTINIIIKSQYLYKSSWMTEIGEIFSSNEVGDIPNAESRQQTRALDF